MPFTILEQINLVLRFLLELCIIVSLGYWGFHTGSNAFYRYSLGIVLPLMAVLVWGMFGAPNSIYMFHGVLHLALEIVLFCAAILALWKKGLQNLAVLFGVVFIINRVLMYVWNQ